MTQGKAASVVMFSAYLYLYQHWTRISRPGERFSHPVMKALSPDGPFIEPDERAFHAACCLNFGEENPQLLVSGGMNTLGDLYGELPVTDLQQTVDSSWILDVDKGEWREVREQGGVEGGEGTAQCGKQSQL